MVLALRAREGRPSAVLGYNATLWAKWGVVGYDADLGNADSGNADSVPGKSKVERLDIELVPPQSPDILAVA